MKNDTKLEFKLIDFLEKMNTGNKLSIDDIEANYNQLQPLIDLLYTVDDFPVDHSDENIYCFTKSDRQHFNKYHIRDIADLLSEYQNENNKSSKYKDCIEDIRVIVKESKLPRRDDEAYQIISSYEPYELTHCISYEMAIRNQDVKSLLKNIQNLTILSKKLFEYYAIYNNAEIEENPYFDLQNIVEEALSLLSQHNIAHDINIKFRNFKLFETHSSVMQIFAQLIMILEEDYYMIYDRKEIVPEGMEEIFKEPNHYEHDIELNQYMDKAIEESIRTAYYVSPRYKDNFTFKDGYAVYQASYEDSKEYDINKIFPNFKRPMREFNQTQVAFNMSLPKDELIAYIEKIKDDYDNKNTSYKTLNQLLYGDDTRTEDKLDHKQKEKYADDFFIYDYYTQSNEEHKQKLELIQKKLSQYHGMKMERGRNDYELINYDEANNKKRINHIVAHKELVPH